MSINQYKLENRPAGERRRRIPQRIEGATCRAISSSVPDEIIHPWVPAGGLSPPAARHERTGRTAQCADFTGYHLRSTLAELANFPIGYDLILGTPPDDHIQRWIWYVIIGPQNHPFPITFFSAQKFRPKTSLERLILLSDPEYKGLSAFSRTPQCTKQDRLPKNDQLLAVDTGTTQANPWHNHGDELQIQQFGSLSVKTFPTEA